MPRLPPLFSRPFVVLGAIVLVWLLLPPLVRSLGRASFFELQAPALQAASHVRDLQEFWGHRTQSRVELIAAGRDLARHNAAMELRLRENELLRAEIGRLEELLRLPSLAGYRYEVARVERRDVSAWWQQIVIRKGRNYHIPAGAPVVFAGGVVGRVREVGQFSSVVDLVSSPEVRLAAVIEGDLRPVSYQGGLSAAFRPPLGRVEFVAAEIEATPLLPRRLLTSGLGGVFPPGLMIGTITELTPGPDGTLQGGPVQLDSRLAAIREVAVVVPDAAPAP